MGTAVALNDVKERRRISAERAIIGRDKSMIAYCNPENKVIGSHYTATKDLDIKEVAARIRADIKTAVKTGMLPQGIKASVRISRYSMGQSIDVSIVAFPSLVLRKEYCLATNFGADLWSDEAVAEREKGRFTKQAEDALEVVSKIHGAYNYNNCDSMSDYVSIKYNGGVSICSSLNEVAKQRYKLEQAISSGLRDE